MTPRAIHVLDHYRRHSQMSTETLIIALVDFLASKKNPAADRSNLLHLFCNFRKHACLTDAQALLLLGSMVDSLDDDAGFQRFFEAFALAHEEVLAHRAHAPAVMAVYVHPSCSTPAPPVAEPSLPVSLPREPVLARVSPQKIDVLIPVTTEDYQLMTAWLTGRGPRPASPGEVLARFHAPVGDAIAHMELTVGPAGPGLDACLTRGKLFWTARPVYHIEEPSEIWDDSTTYNLRLVCAT